MTLEGSASQALGCSCGCGARGQQQGTKTPGLLREGSIGFGRWVKPMRWSCDFQLRVSLPADPTARCAVCSGRAFNPFCIFCLFISSFRKELLDCHCHLPSGIQHWLDGKTKYEEGIASRNLMLAQEDQFRFGKSPRRHDLKELRIVVQNTWHILPSAEGTGENTYKRTKKLYILLYIKWPKLRKNVHLIFIGFTFLPNFTFWLSSTMRMNKKYPER